MSRPALSVLPLAPPSPAVILELVKPITWFPPMWAFLCGVVSSGAPVGGRWWVVVLGVIICGPLLCGSSQAINDWFDRHVDAINEPRRPIPSGRLPGRWGLWVALFWSALSLIATAALGVRVFTIALIGLVLAWLYSAPPVRLKQNGWWGNLACAFCYEGFAWITGALVLIQTSTSIRIVGAAFLYSVGAHGIMTLNDFKSIVGDREMGIGSLPVRLGTNGAARAACLIMAVSQALVIGLLLVWHQPVHAAAVLVLLLIQGLMMRRFLREPRRFATWYSGSAIPFYVAGMLVTAFALRGLAP